MFFRKKCKVPGSKTLGRKTHLAAVIPLIMAAQAQAVEFYAGGVEAKLDTQVSIGSSWRVEDQDEGIVNSDNVNDGDKNFDKNEAFSQVFKGSSDLQLSYENYGAFVRTKYWYDAALEDDDNLSDSNRHDLAKFSGVEIFDAFVYGDFEVFDMPLDLRLGKQVVSWGESTFILGSINSINSFDVGAFRRPGAKIKEAVIPVNLAFANLGLTDNLSAEAFYQLEFRETVLDACGTYFSDRNYIGAGCSDVVTPAGNVSRDENGIRRPDGDGQFGVALRYVSEALDTEFGLYAMNIHSRNPVVNASKASFDESAALGSGFIDGAIQGLAYQITNGSGSIDPTLYDSLDAGTQAAIYGGASVGVLAGITVSGNPGFGAQGASFNIAYPEDMQIAALSFATNVAGIALSGEVSHTVDAPIMINDTQLIGAMLQADAINAVTMAGALQQGATAEQAAAAGSVAVAEALGEVGSDILAIQDGQSVAGFRLFDVTQLQLTAVKLFDQVLGASRVALVTEIGYSHVHSFDEDGSIKYDGVSVTAVDGTESLAYTVTQGAWGYRTLINAEYSDVYAGVSLTPEVFWSQDVKGVSSNSGSRFIEGNEMLGLTLNANYLNTYNASISYTRLSGDESYLIRDRDYASISVGMQF